MLFYNRRNNNILNKTEIINILKNFSLSKSVNDYSKVFDSV